MTWSNQLQRSLWQSATWVTAFGAVYLFSLDTALAQQIIYPIPLQQEWQQEFLEVTLENYRGLMEPALTPQEMDRLSNVRFEFPVGPHDQNFNFYSSSENRVVMPVASLLFFKDLAFAAAWLSLKGYSIIPLLDYASVFANGGLVRWPEEKRFPKDALGIPADAGSNAEVVKRYQEMVVDIVLFVLAHELGHIMQGFEEIGDYDRHCWEDRPKKKGRKKDSDCLRKLGRLRQVEQSADSFALELFRRINRPPLGLPIFFSITSRLQPVGEFALSNKDWDLWVLGKREHPLDGRRIQAAANFIAANRADFEKGLRNPATASTRITNSVSEFTKLASLVDDRSLFVTQADCTLTYGPEDLMPRKGAVLDVVPRDGERFVAKPWSGVYEGTVVGNKIGQSTAIRLILRRDGARLTGDTQYLCFRGRVDGSITGDMAAVRWTVGNIRRTLTMHAEAAGASIRATWRSDTDEGGDGTVTATRVSSP